MTPLDTDTCCDRFADEIAAFDAILRAADPDAAVPTCPGWTVADLTRHLGGIYRWVDHIVATRTPTPISRRDVDLGAPDDGSDAGTWADWLTAGGEAVLARFRETPDDVAVWTWGDGDTVGWWKRRLLHETLVHRLDLASATGTTAAVEPTVAVDAIDEHLDNLSVRARSNPEVAKLQGDGSLHLHATDAEGEWMIDLRADGFDIRHEHGKGSVAARGPALDLLAALLGRGPVDRLEVFGDADLLDWWITHSAS